MQPAEILNEIAALARCAGGIVLRHFAAAIPLAARKSTRSDVVTDYAGAPNPQWSDRSHYVASNSLIHGAMLRRLQSARGR